MDRLRKPVVCHIWNAHPDEVLDVDSTDLNNLLREQLKVGCFDLQLPGPGIQRV